MDHVRPFTDIPVVNHGGVDMVLAFSGGVSCYDCNPPPGNGPIWELPQSSPHPDGLYLRDDGNGHWTWEPAVDMTLADFRTRLATVGRNFAKLAVVGGLRVSP
jgi:hypothetical protein